MIGWDMKMTSHPNSNASFITIWDGLIWRRSPNLTRSSKLVAAPNWQMDRQTLIFLCPHQTKITRKTDNFVFCFMTTLQHNMHLHRIPRLNLCRHPVSGSFTCTTGWGIWSTRALESYNSWSIGAGAISLSPKLFRESGRIPGLSTPPLSPQAWRELALWGLAAALAGRDMIKPRVYHTGGSKSLLRGKQPRAP